MAPDLYVRPIKQGHAGRGLAAIHQSVLDTLGIESGDFVEINGPDGSTVARAWPGYNGDNARYLRVDGQIRQEIGARIDDTVSIEAVDVEPADSISIAFTNKVNVTGNFNGYLHDRLVDKVVSEGKSVPVRLGRVSAQSGDTFSAIVTDTSPDGDVLVTEDTEVSVTQREMSDLEQEKTQSSVTYEDIGGLSKELDQVREMIELPMRHPELFNQLGIDPPKGVLLHGPPGTGKTLMAKAVANEIDAYFTSISGPEIMSKFYGESEEQLREVFEEAEEQSPAIVFIDEIDSIAPKRGEAGGDVERRIVAQLLSLMDGLDDRGDVVVIGATNRVDAIDPALRRGGRFDREIEIGIPDQTGREEILQVHTRGMPLTDDVDISALAKGTHGYVGADIAALTKEAAMTALRRVRPELDLEADTLDADALDRLEITAADFKSARKDITPSALREVFVEVPDVSWDEVGGLSETKGRLCEMVQWPLDYPDVFEKMDMAAPKGVMMYGPPGTGKTLLAKAIANESESNFISIKGPELLNKYVGESEKGVREVFEKARENAPTIVFFDEIDAIAGQRGGNMNDSGVGERVVSQLLTELDGLESLEDVVVIATTNRPDLIDAALMRPGRFDRHIHVPVPDTEACEAIFRVHTKNKPLADDVDVEWLAKQTDGYVGADIEAVCREASMAASRELIDGQSPADVSAKLDSAMVRREHFEQALDEVGASVDVETRDEYESLEMKMKGDDSDQKETRRTFQ